MSENTPEQQAPEAQEAPAQQQPTEAPPWGDDFDAEKAWKLVQNLRADKEKLASRPTLNAEQQQQLDEYNRLVEASKSEAQRQQEAVDAATREAERARAEANIYKAAATHGIPVDLFEGDEMTRAEKIAAYVAEQAAKTQSTSTPLPTRPVEQMRPGATPGEAASEDDVLYQRLFG